MRKPTNNPMQELAKWKANHKAQAQAEAKAQAQTQVKAQAVENAPSRNDLPKQESIYRNGKETLTETVKADGAKGNNKPNFHKIYAATMPQLNRQFALTNRATMLCKYRYPNDYHHKHQMAQECEQLRTDLKGGKHLLNDMLKPLGLTLTKEQRDTLKRFNLAVGYLNRQLKISAQIVEEIDGLTAEELAQLVELREGAGNE